MKFRPLHDRVVVRRLDQETKSSGGIIIPDTAKEKPMQGEILAIGPGERNEKGKVTPLDVKAGDRILFGKYSGQEITLDGEEYLIVQEDEVLAVIEDKTTKKAAVITGQTKTTTKKTAREALTPGQKKLTALTSEAGARSTAVVKKTKTVAKKARKVTARARRQNAQMISKATRTPKKVVKRAKKAVRPARKTVSRSASRFNR